MTSFFKKTLRTYYTKFLKRSKLRRYIKESAIIKVRLGTGGHRQLGWLCTDAFPSSRDIVYLDVTKEFPFKNETVDYYVAEHVIEHLKFDEALFALKECFRTLKTGGSIRIATPDLKWLRFMSSSNPTPEALWYRNWLNSTFGDQEDSIEGTSAAIAINRAFRSWGHTFIYDFDALQAVLKKSGFDFISRKEVGVSGNPNLVNVEARAQGDNDWVRANNLESMVVEATKVMRSP